MTRRRGAAWGLAAALLGACASATVERSVPAIDTTAPTTTTVDTTTTVAATTNVPTTTTGPAPPAAPTSVAPRPTLPADLDNGREGRNTYGDPGHRPPAEACDVPAEDAGRSSIERVLPDGPLAPDGSLAFTAGVCVYLPPGYSSSDLSYPLLVLLHGGGADAASFVSFGELQETLDRSWADDPATALIVAMPDGTDAQWYDREDGTLANATYVLDHVLPFLDHTYRTLGTRESRAIGGISNGGYGALHLASLAPDLFVAAGAMSANLGGVSLAPEAAGPDRSPIARAGQLDDVDLVFDIAVECDDVAPERLCFTLGVDLAFLEANRSFVEAVERARATSGSTAVLDYQEREGSHAWYWWRQWLEERHLPFFWDRLAPPA